MNITFDLFGYTVASINVDLSALLGHDVTAVQQPEAPINRLIRGMSGYWTRKAFERPRRSPRLTPGSNH